MKSIVSKRVEGSLLKFGLNYNTGLCYYFYLVLWRLVFFLRIPKKKHKIELGDRYHWTFDWDVRKSQEFAVQNFDTRTITVLGVKYSMEVFETLADPDPNKVYQFERNRSGDVSVIQVTGFPIPKRI